jgi:hypothetical protein
MNKIKDRGYSLPLIESHEYEPSELLLEFLKGCKIIEARANETQTMIEQSYVAMTPKGVRMPEGVVIEYKHPSFMVEREGKRYVIAIDSLLGWTLMEVKYDQE